MGRCLYTRRGNCTILCSVDPAFNVTWYQASLLHFRLPIAPMDGKMFCRRNERNGNGRKKVRKMDGKIFCSRMLDSGFNALTFEKARPGINWYVVFSQSDRYPIVLWSYSDRILIVIWSYNEGLIVAGIRVGKRVRIFGRSFRSEGWFFERTKPLA